MFDWSGLGAMWKQFLGKISWKAPKSGGGGSPTAKSPPSKGAGNGEPPAPPAAAAAGGGGGAEGETREDVFLRKLNTLCHWGCLFLTFSELGVRFTPSPCSP